MSCIVIAYPGNGALATALGDRLGGEIVPLAVRQFPDGEFHLRVGAAVAGRTVVVACGLDRPNEKAMGLYLLASTLKELGARRILLAAPYLGYMRQDKPFHEGEGVSARHFARLLSGIFDGLVTVDPHLHRIHSLQEIYTIPTRAVAAAPEISAWIAKHVQAPALVGPDSESEQWVSGVAAGANCPFVVLEKERRGDRDVDIVSRDVAVLRDRTPVLVDDIISTARTMIAAAKHIVASGFGSPLCIGVHAILAGTAYEDLMRSGVRQVVTCNSVLHPTNEIDLHPRIAAGIGELL